MKNEGGDLSLVAVDNLNRGFIFQKWDRGLLPMA